MSVKSRVLSALESRKGESVSGEALAQELEVSRAAVWKAIGELRGAGYQIEAATRRGYRLGAQSDLVSAEGMRLHLRGKRERLIEYRDCCPSTNQALKQLAAQGAAEGTLFLAGEQSAGRGRLGRAFFSPPDGGIYLSALLRPQLFAQEATLVTAAAAVAVCRAVETLCGISLGIKWVNDLYFEGQKVGGILTEAAADLESGAVEYLVVGIGLNCTTPQTAFPEELRGLAGSLSDGKGGAVSRCVLAAELVNRLEELMPTLSERAFLAEYRTRSILLGQEVEVIQNEQRENARAIGIDDDARLLVQWADKTITALRSGEVRVRRTT